MLDLDDNRLATAKELGATHIQLIQRMLKMRCSSKIIEPSWCGRSH